MMLPILIIINLLFSKRFNTQDWVISRNFYSYYKLFNSSFQLNQPFLFISFNNSIPNFLLILNLINLNKNQNTFFLNFMYLYRKALNENYVLIGGLPTPNYRTYTNYLYTNKSSFYLRESTLNQNSIYQNSRIFNHEFYNLYKYNLTITNSTGTREFYIDTNLIEKNKYILTLDYFITNNLFFIKNKKNFNIVKPFYSFDFINSILDFNRNFFKIPNVLSTKSNFWSLNMFGVNLKYPIKSFVTKHKIKFNIGTNWLSNTRDFFTCAEPGYLINQVYVYMDKPIDIINYKHNISNFNKYFFFNSNTKNYLWNIANWPISSKLKVYTIKKNFTLFEPSELLIFNKNMYNCIRLFFFKNEIKRSNHFFNQINSGLHFKKYNLSENDQYKLIMDRVLLNKKIENKKYLDSLNCVMDFENMIKILNKLVILNKISYKNIDWYGKTWAEHKLIMLHFNVHNRKNFRSYWIQKKKIGVYDYPEYATPISNITELQTMDSYFYYFLVKPNVSQPFFNNITGNIPNNLGIKLNYTTNQNTGLWGYFSDINLNYNFYSIFFNYFFHPIFFNYLQFKWHEKILLNKLWFMTNVWPYNNFFQYLRLNITLWDLKDIHGLNVISHFDQNVKWLRGLLKKVIYRPFFSWLYDYHFWKNRLNYFFKKMFYWSFWFESTISLYLKSKNLIWIWLNILSPGLMAVIYLNMMLVNVYWLSFRFEMLSWVLDIFWRPGYILRYGRYLFTLNLWFLDLSESLKRKLYKYLLPFYCLYTYLISSYKIYIEYIYPLVHLFFWLVLDMCGKVIFYNIKLSLFFIKYIGAFFLKFLNFNLEVLISVLAYTILSICYAPIILVKVVLYIKNLSNLFLYNCNFILITTTLRFLLRKLFIKYGIDLSFFNKFSIYLFVVHNYIWKVIVCNISFVSIITVTCFLTLLSPYIISYESCIYSFLEFITSYTHIYFENKVYFNYVEPVKMDIYLNDEVMDSTFKNYIDSSMRIDYTVLGMVILVVCFSVANIIDFNTIYVNIN